MKEVEGWRARIAALDLAARYGVQAPALQPWGLLVPYVWDPSGVLRHFAKDPAQEEDTG